MSRTIPSRQNIYTHTWKKAQLASASVSNYSEGFIKFRSNPTNMNGWINKQGETYAPFHFCVPLHTWTMAGWLVSSSLLSIQAKGYKIALFMNAAHLAAATVVAGHPPIWHLVPVVVGDGAASAQFVVTCLTLPPLYAVWWSHKTLLITICVGWWDSGSAQRDECCEALGHYRMAGRRVHRAMMAGGSWEGTIRWMNCCQFGRIGNVLIFVRSL